MTEEQINELERLAKKPIRTMDELIVLAYAVPELIAENRALQERVRELKIREVDYIEESNALLCTKHALEKQRELLAKELVSRGHILGSVAEADLVKPWIDAVEQAAKEAGE